MRVRHAEPANMAGALALLVDFYEVSNLSYYGALDKNALLDTLAGLATGDDSALLVAVDDKNKVYGVIGLQMVTAYFNPEVKISTEVFWWVDPKHRGDGVGRMLFDASEGWAKEKKATATTMVSLDMSGVDVAAAYKKRGYTLMESMYARRI